MAKERRAHHLDHRRSAQEILNVRAEVTKDQSRPAAVVEWIGAALANPLLFIAVLAAHLLWVVLNLPIVPWIEPWDPYPFTFFASFTSAEAPFIALLVLMYQRRSSRVSELREEVNLQVSLHMEQEMTVMLRELAQVLEKLGVTSREDPDLRELLQHELDPKLLMESLRHQLQQNEDSEQATAP